MSSFNLTSKTTIDEFKQELFKYVTSYNNEVHSQLNGLTPVERFFNSGDEIKELSAEMIEKAFLLEID